MHNKGCSRAMHAHSHRWCAARNILAAELPRGSDPGQCTTRGANEPRTHTPSYARTLPPCCTRCVRAVHARWYAARRVCVMRTVLKHESAGYAHERTALARQLRAPGVATWMHWANQRARGSQHARSTSSAKRLAQRLAMQQIKDWLAAAATRASVYWCRCACPPAARPRRRA